MQKAFQAWLAEKQRDRQCKLQQQRQTVFLSSIPASFWEPERNLDKKERKWRGNFGTPAQLVGPAFGPSMRVDPPSEDQEEGGHIGLPRKMGLMIL